MCFCWTAITTACRCSWMEYPGSKHDTYTPYQITVYCAGPYFDWSLISRAFISPVAYLSVYLITIINVGELGWRIPVKVPEPIYLFQRPSTPSNRSLSWYIYSEHMVRGVEFSISVIFLPFIRFPYFDYYTQNLSIPYYRCFEVSDPW